LPPPFSSVAALAVAAVLTGAGVAVATPLGFTLLAGNALQRASHTIDLIIVGVAVVAVTGVVFLVRRQTAKLGLQAEAAYPGPLE
jgi:hypothetical protein